jgi:RNA methyltransferase, TrmH family
VTEGVAGRHNAAVKAARLLQQKKHRLSERCFLIEGLALVEAATDRGADIKRVFALDPGSRSDDQPHKGVAAFERSAAFGPLRERTMYVDRHTLDSLSTTKTPQGIVAVVGFIDRDHRALEQLLSAEGRALVLVLPDLSDPGNAGTLIRSAEAFGVGAICFGPTAVDPYNDKLVRASMGSLFRVPLVRYERWEDLVATLRALHVHVMAADASGDDVRSITVPQRVALVVGQERHGLAGIARGDLDVLVGVPQHPGPESLNAGVAGSLLLYELARAQGLFERT